MEADHLGRLVAAERNARAAIDLARAASQDLAAIRHQLDQAVRSNILLAEQVNGLQVRLAMMRGTGPTGG